MHASGISSNVEQEKKSLDINYNEIILAHS